MESIEQYFGRPDTPSAGSPVGILMNKILVKFPGITLDDARAKANQLLQDAAKRKSFSLPRVLSEEEQEQQRQQLKSAFAKPSAAMSQDVASSQSRTVAATTPRQRPTKAAQHATSHANPGSTHEVVRVTEPKADE
jgi:hypothetical protein